MRRMRIVGLDHVQVANPKGTDAEARAFYVDVLGFAEVPKPPALAVRGGFWLTAPGVSLHIGAETDFVPARKAHPALLVEDLTEAKKHLADAGVSWHDDEPIAGYDRGYIHDPFGNKIEIMQRLN